MYGHFTPIRAIPIIIPLKSMSIAQVLQLRLRTDLMTAMREHRELEKALLRALLAAIDNAQAVPVGDRHDKYVVHAFGDPAVEVPRLELSVASLGDLLRREQQDRLESAEQLARLGQGDRALRLRQEARIIESYVAFTGAQSSGV